MQIHKKSKNKLSSTTTANSFTILQLLLLLLLLVMTTATATIKQECTYVIMFITLMMHLQIFVLSTLHLELPPTPILTYHMGQYTSHSITTCHLSLLLIRNSYTLTFVHLLSV